MAAPTITRTPITDDDGTGTTGTVLNDAWKQEFYAQIDALIAAEDALTKVLLPFTQGNAGTQAQATTAYYGPAHQSATEDAVGYPVPIACTLTRLFVSLAANVGGAAQTVTVTLRKNKVDTAVTCTIASGAAAGSDTAHTVTFAAGDLIDLKVVTSATTGAIQLRASASQ
jgi:hypothetical protein